MHEGLIIVLQLFGEDGLKLFLNHQLPGLGKGSRDVTELFLFHEIFCRLESQFFSGFNSINVTAVGGFVNRVFNKVVYVHKATLSIFAGQTFKIHPSLQSWIVLKLSFSLDRNTSINVFLLILLNCFYHCKFRSEVELRGFLHHQA